MHVKLLPRHTTRRTVSMGTRNRSFHANEDTHGTVWGSEGMLTYSSVPSATMGQLSSVSWRLGEEGLWDGEQRVVLLLSASPPVCYVQNNIYY